MNTRKQILIAVSVLITIATLTAIPAQAGILDWFSSNDAKADTATGSFNALYASLQTERPSNDSAVVLDDSVTAPTSPLSDSTSKKVTYHTYTVQVSGYSSEVAQTDASPFITADGSYVTDGVVATNMFPFGTHLKIPSLYGDKIFTVHDRMNTRYQHNVDIWFASKADALKLGRRTVQIQVLQ
ncbi:MAG TPA: hypothetical protein VMU12_03345 [Candidatus Paceibacterota bacterium]|nr:hypothetical protein [Candidatus Paceibacterota bacterium]